jgi:hypothetical protein
MPKKIKVSWQAHNQDLTKSNNGSDSSSEKVDENLFLENLEKLAASGELDTIEGVQQAYFDAFGEERHNTGNTSIWSITPNSYGYNSFKYPSTRYFDAKTRGYYTGISNKSSSFDNETEAGFLLPS